MRANGRRSRSIHAIALQHIRRAPMGVPNDPAFGCNVLLACLKSTLKCNTLPIGPTPHRYSLWICSGRFGANFPIRLLRYVRSTANSCDALATESFGRPATLAGNNVLPGAASQDRLLVSGTQTTVARRLRLGGLPCTTTTGRRNPGAEPARVEEVLAYARVQCATGLPRNSSTDTPSPPTSSPRCVLNASRNAAVPAYT